MTVRYRTSGDEIEARKLLGEGRHQLSILRNAMSFQNLKQDQRQVRFDNGTVINCLSCFGQDVIDIFVPPPLIPLGEIKPEIKHDWFRFRIIRDDDTVMEEPHLYPELIELNPDYPSVAIGIYRERDEIPNPQSIWDVELVGCAYGLNDYSINVDCWNKTGDIWHYRNENNPDEVIEFSYNTISKIWTVPFFNWKRKIFPYHIYDASLYPRRFWVQFNMNFTKNRGDETHNGNSVEAWHSVTQKNTDDERIGYVHKRADYYNKDDKLRPRFYQVKIPYWDVIGENVIPTYAAIGAYKTCENKEDNVPVRWGLTEGDLQVYHVAANKSFLVRRRIKSSIPYSVKNNINSIQVNDYGPYYITRNTWPPGGYCSDPPSADICGFTPSPSLRLRIEATNEDGDNTYLYNRNLPKEKPGAYWHFVIPPITYDVPFKLIGTIQEDVFDYCLTFPSAPSQETVIVRCLDGDDNWVEVEKTAFYLGNHMRTDPSKQHEPGYTVPEERLVVKVRYDENRAWEEYLWRL